MSIAAVSKVRPCAGVTVSPGSKADCVSRISVPKPLKTESRRIIAATGTATETTLKPAIRLTTDRDAGENR